MEIISITISIAGIITGVYFLYEKYTSYLIFKKKKDRYRTLIRLKNNKLLFVKNLDDKDSKFYEVELNEGRKEVHIHTAEYKRILENQFKIKKYKTDIPLELIYKVSKDEGLVVDDIIVKNLEESRNNSLKVALSSGLISSVVANYLSIIPTKSNVNKSTIIGVMINKRIDRDVKAYAFLIFSFILYSVFCYMDLFTFSYISMAILMLFIGSLAINQKMLEIRVRKGLYGTNSYEVREIVQFVEKYSDKSDFTDGGNAKKLMPNLEVEVKSEGMIWDEVCM